MLWQDHTHKYITEWNQLVKTMHLLSGETKQSSLLLIASTELKNLIVRSETCNRWKHGFARIRCLSLHEIDFWDKRVCLHVRFANCERCKTNPCTWQLFINNQDEWGNFSHQRLYLFQKTNNLIRSIVLLVFKFPYWKKTTSDTLWCIAALFKANLHTCWRVWSNCVFEPSLPNIKSLIFGSTKHKRRLKRQNVLS